MLKPAEDRGGPAQPLLTVRNLVKYFPVRGDVLGRTTAKGKFTRR